MIRRTRKLSRHGSHACTAPESTHRTARGGNNSSTNQHDALTAPPVAQCLEHVLHQKLSWVHVHRVEIECGHHIILGAKQSDGKRRTPTAQSFFRCTGRKRQRRDDYSSKGDLTEETAPRRLQQQGRPHKNQERCLRLNVLFEKGSLWNTTAAVTALK